MRLLAAARAFGRHSAGSKIAILAGLFLFICLMAVAALLVRTLRRANRMTHVPRARVPAQAAARAMAEFPSLQQAILRTSDGLTLRGWFVPGERRAAVIFVHGGFANRLQLLPEARVVNRHGYGFLVYDSRSSGESDGDLESWGEGQQRDVSAALDYVSSRPEVDPERIAVLGFSIGGTAVALAASHDKRARAVILYATWTSLEDEVRQKSGRLRALTLGPTLFVMRRAGVDVDAIRPIDVIGAIQPRPLLMIAGTRDDDTPVEVMQRLFDRAGSPKELWIEPGAEHGSYLATNPGEYESRVVGFLNDALKSP